jgi:hypothetical protein
MEAIGVTAAKLVEGTDLLAGWAERHRARRRARRLSPPQAGIRFAFYGRISTEDFQDRVSSLRWQRAVADDVVAGCGTIVAEFFDVGYSRRLPWADRPHAGALLAALADPNRGFDAVVVGEFERAFYGDQLAEMAPVFECHGCSCGYPRSTGRSTVTTPPIRP